MGATCADSATNSINVVRGTIPAHHARAPRASSVVATCSVFRLRAAERISNHAAVSLDCSSCFVLLQFLVVGYFSR